MAKYFPIKTATSCQLKWNWSTLVLYNGETSSCHRSGLGKITPETFDTFHNTEKKQSERRRMLDGNWPEDTSCYYCRDIEQAGGSSDRIRHLGIPGQSPTELETDPGAVVVQPTILEVYFNNQCNLSCVYCVPNLSSKINAEYTKHGKFEKNGVILEPIRIDSNYKKMLEKFWEWMKQHSSGLVRLHIAGGESFYQPELENCLEYFESSEHPNLEFCIITNLTLPPAKLDHYIQRFRKLLAARKLKRIDITCSIDCLGAEQEYTRYGMKVDNWIANFETLLDHQWITLHVNQVISVLTIKTMPELIEKIKTWKSKRKIGHFFSVVEPGPSYLVPNILGNKVFEQDFAHILKSMPQDTNEDLLALQYMQGIAAHYSQSSPDPVELLKLKTFLDETDRRRGTSWPDTFPWLMKELQHVV
jgi:sulfatase maturation enzyme AslB (radical SAM superfamily)